MLAADEIPSTIYEQVFETDQKRPFSDTEPLIIDALEPTRSLSFSSLHTNVRAFAAALRSNEYGIKEGDVVAICSTSDIEYPIALHGVMAAGAGACLIPAVLTSNEMANILRLAEPRLIVAHPASYQTITAALKEDGVDLPMVLMNNNNDNKADVPNLLDVCNKHDPNTPLPKVSPDTNAYLACTSGSTAAMKLVNISHRVGVLRIRELAATMTRTANERARSLATSQFHGALASAIACQASLQCGIRQYVLNSNDLELMLSKIQEFQITSVSLAPFNVVQAANQPELIQKYDVSSLQVGTTAGQMVRREDKLKAKENLGLALMLTFYGSTESYVPLGFIPQHNIPETSGKIPDREGWSVKLVNEHGQEVQKGEMGELWAKNPTLADGYYKCPEDTAEAFDKDGFFHTKDIFILQDNDEFLFIGRKNEMILTKESKYCAPKPIEDICLAYGGIRECIVVGAHSDKLGYQVPRAYVVLKDPASIADKDGFTKELIAYVNERITNAVMRLDGGVRILDQFPRTAVGKTDMQLLRNMARQELEALESS
ncbi:hypothetical protein O0I10_003419 [Lichtheimia ornata]|uniref:Uncharacterized protein n=1 Tax=Lichtheimia ornata TaxID=688661 RepID=A0AAD7VAX0_9FUNG|nr:uncharacterized protein O0I10_003419 [Lichtheimia ornata]KAJ8660776.1 hypothetical protein O0I10_003419 [Lichtheimia ornata]